MEIRFNNVTYTYNKKTILNNLNLHFKQNKITAIVGPNGSGKTTILELIIKRKKVNEGEILYKPKFTKTNIGIVTEEQIFEFQTVEEELIQTIEKHKYKTKNIEKRITDALILVGLNPKILSKNPNNLSKGEKTKLTLAKALSYNPKIIIIDEIHLDQKTTVQLIKLLRLMKLKYNKTIIILTKNTDFAHAISDYIYIINNGEVITKGTKYKVFTNFQKLKENKLKIPKVIELAHLIENKKNVKMEYRDDINDLMKDIYRIVR